MLQRQTTITLRLTQNEDGRVKASVDQYEQTSRSEELLEIGFSSASSCFEELGSAIDGILFSTLVVSPEPLTQGATG